MHCVPARLDPLGACLYHKKLAGARRSYIFVWRMEHDLAAKWLNLYMWRRNRDASDGKGLDSTGGSQPRSMR
jgi:hypothetical protein